MKINLNTIAKIAAWVGSALLAIAPTGILGKYSTVAYALGPVLIGGGVHMASNTSAGHPDGSSTTLAQASQAATQEVKATINSNASVAAAEAARKT